MATDHRDRVTGGPIAGAAPVPNDASPAACPLVSCVMPTRDRARYVAQSIRYFQRQDYPNRELVIVYDDPDDLPDGIEDPNIHLLRCGHSSVGGKRDLGLRAARGEIIAHWDDDDWYSPQRLSHQVKPIAAGIADITGLGDTLFMALPAGEFWQVSHELYARLFVEAVAGGTLVFWRDVWRRSGPYPAISLREDAEFLLKAIRDGARLCRIPGRDLHIYVRHGRNTWRFSEGRYLLQSGWTRTPEPECLAADRRFYLAPACHAAAVAKQPPRVSCIMPTANRRAFVPRAIEQFLSQNYPARELIVIDDGSDSVADLVPRLETVRYLRLDQRVSLGMKRNMACEMARGELIAHWDDDDWMAPGWLSSQIATLAGRSADVCGLDRIFFYASETRHGWRYVYDGSQPWVYGGTLCYTRELWRRLPFADIDVGEDNCFVWSAQPKRIAINDRCDLYVASVHRHNTSPKVTTGRRWHRIPVSQLERLMRQETRATGPGESQARAAEGDWR